MNPFGYPTTSNAAVSPDGLPDAADADAPLLRVRAVSHAYAPRGQQLAVLDGISLDIRRGEFISLVGPSGCGKSTLLRLIAGLEEPSAGQVSIGGRRARLGQVGWMPQRDLLHPWLDAVGNAAVSLEVRGLSRREARDRARELLTRFGLVGFESARPRELSGGMRQRVALARTVLGGGSVMLLDEPFGGLDALTRAHLQAWLLDVWPSLDRSVVMVTHDIDEALLLSDAVYALSGRPGRLLERVAVPFGRPRTVRGVLADPRFAALKLRLLDLLGQGI